MTKAAVGHLWVRDTDFYFFFGEATFHCLIDCKRNCFISHFSPPHTMIIHSAAPSTSAGYGVSV